MKGAPTIQNVIDLRREIDETGGWPTVDRWREHSELAIFALATLIADPPATTVKREAARLALDFLFVDWRTLLPEDLRALMVDQ